MAPPSFGWGFLKVVPKLGIIIMHGNHMIKTKLRGTRKKVINWFINKNGTVLSSSVQYIVVVSYVISLGCRKN